MFFSKSLDYIKSIGLSTLLFTWSVHAGWSSMPLELYPADSTPVPVLVVHYSGDAGFNVTDKSIAAGLHAVHIPLVGVNSLSYFMKKQTPELCAADLTDIIIHFTTLWNTQYCIVSGYSFGADVVPFMVTRLDDAKKSIVKCMVSTSPSEYADFQFHMQSWLGFASSQQYPVKPEMLTVAKIMPVLCFYGKDDDGSIGPVLEHSSVECYVQDRKHRMGSDCDSILAVLIPRILKIAKMHTNSSSIR